MHYLFLSAHTVGYNDSLSFEKKRHSPCRGHVPANTHDAHNEGLHSADTDIHTYTQNYLINAVISKAHPRSRACTHTHIW